MLSRILYSLRIFWRYRARLKSYLLNPQLQLANVSLLSIKLVQQRDVEAIALDFDGVLASHGESQPRAEAISWLKDLQQKFEPRKIYILSNKPTPVRQAYFMQNFPEIGFIVAKRKKPFPDGIEEILRDSGLRPDQLLLVDDRLGTGIVGAISCGIQAYWITKPYINLRARPVRELFFVGLRWFERLACKII